LSREPGESGVKNHLVTAVEHGEAYVRGVASAQDGPRSVELVRADEGEALRDRLRQADGLDIILAQAIRRLRQEIVGVQGLVDGYGSAIVPVEDSNVEVDRDV
jgi:hypothetical protein